MIQGYKTGEGETPVGNIRHVTYYEKEPDTVLSDRGLRDQVRDSLDRGSPYAGQRRNFIEQLFSQGSYVEEGEWVDAGELPRDRAVGEAWAELFVTNRPRPETWRVD